jgi:4-amino-4-deoxy-L-arabinose transferase-like glycosyltransferase
VFGAKSVHHSLESHFAGEMRLIRALFIALFLLGGGIRAVDLWRPVDGTVRESWRECDIAAVARNFCREGMNILYPRIDWRGNGPGYAEMEFPIYPWTIAVLYKTFGFHEEIGRVLSYGFSLASILVFFKLARYLLPVAGALGASLFFVLSPLAVRISNGLQPEGLMFLCYILAAYTFIRWIDEGKSKHYWIALGSTALAILAKANAAHIGLLFAAVLLTEKGFGALKSGRVWVFAVLCLLPGALWYYHAHNLWLTYGNSLGVSNEYHWIGWDFFTNSRFIMGIARLEIKCAWMLSGLGVACLGAVLRWNRREVRLGAYWYGAVLLYYIITSRTTSEVWAVYYHVVTVPPAALLFGAGIRSLNAWCLSESRTMRAFLWSAAAVLLIFANYFFEVFNLRSLEKGLLVLGAAAALTVVLWCGILRDRRDNESAVVPLHHSFIFALSSFFVFTTFMMEAFASGALFHPGSEREVYECAEAFKPHVSDGALIVASGGPCRDEDGYIVAYNASYMFYWLDQKGWNVCHEEQSVERLTAFARKGASYFVGEKGSMAHACGFETEVRREFKVVAECTKALLLRIKMNEPSIGKLD